MARIAVLGGGLSGVTAAFEMQDKVGRAHEVMLISDRPEFQFTPSNPWVAVGWRRPDQITVDLARCLGKRDIAFRHATVARVDPTAKAATTADGETIAYDYLVIATGPELAFDEVEGLGPDDGFTQSICTTGHAEKAHRAFEAFARDPGPLVVGAAQGASCFGPAYEFAFILDTELRRRKIRDKTPMTFVTPEPYIGHLGLDGVGDTKSLLESELRQRHIHWITNARIDKVTEKAVHVTEVADDGAHVVQQEVASKYAMILPAFRGIEALRGVEGLVNPRGFVTVDRRQQNAAFPDVFSVGVCVAIPPVGETPVPVGVPKTGFMIESMTAAATANIAALINGETPDDEATWNAICLADFGDGGVAFVAMPQIPPRNVNWSASGRWVHGAKVAFEKYFLSKVCRGRMEPMYEKLVLKWIGAEKVREG